MSEKRYRKMMEAREEERALNRANKPPFEICAIGMIAISAITWIGCVGIKRYGGKLPWE